MTPDENKKEIAAEQRHSTRRTLIGEFEGGRVLDVATGAGAFARVLAAELRGYDEIVGIDTDPRRAAAFAAVFQDDPSVRYVEMDATAMTFEPGSFDTIAISDSLHHFSDPAVVLSEMWRVLKRGGTFVVSEMYRDGLSPAQETHAELHHLAAAVDEQEGTVHRETYRREELRALVRSLPLTDVRELDHREAGPDPFAEDLVADVAALIDGLVARSPNDATIRARGEALRRRVRDVGFETATTLVAVGRK